MTQQADVTLSVVESDEPTEVRMYNSIGCEIGAWTLKEWAVEIYLDRISLQIGDKFVLE